MSNFQEGQIAKTLWKGKFEANEGEDRDQTGENTAGEDAGKEEGNVVGVLYPGVRNVSNHPRSNSEERRGGEERSVGQSEQNLLEKGFPNQQIGWLVRQVDLRVDLSNQR